MRTIYLQSAVWKEGKFFVAQCLNVDVSSFGKTQREALANVKEALELYFEDMPRRRVLRVQKPTVVTQELQYV